MSDQICERRYESRYGEVVMLLRDKNFNCQVVISHDGFVVTEDYIDPHSASKRFDYLKDILEQPLTLGEAE